MSDAIKYRQGIIDGGESDRGRSDKLDDPDKPQIYFDFVSYHSFCEAYGISLKTLVDEYTQGQMILLSAAGRVLTPKTPKEEGPEGVVKVLDKSRKKFKDMTSASEALSAMGPLK